jgi:hypothetical protein
LLAFILGVEVERHIGTGFSVAPPQFKDQLPSALR